MSSRKILIVDDNPDDIEAITRALQKCNECQYQVIAASSGDMGIELAERTVFDCVLLDYHLPGVTGIELFSNLREKVGKIPILILTGQTDQMVAAQLIKSGAQDYINKFTLTSVKLHEKISDAMVNSARQYAEISGAINCKILIVDDNVDDIELCTRLLKDVSVKYTFEYATSGKQGLETIPTFNPDCVLLDYSMPGASGLDILTHIVNAYPFTPVILMTGQGDESIAVNAIKRGAENYLVKGSLESELLDKTVKIAVQKKKLEQQLVEKEKLLNEKQDELAAAHAFQTLVQDTLPGYIFVKDTDFRIVRANQRFMELFPEEMRGKVIGYTTFEQYQEHEMQAFLQKDKEAFEKGVSETLEKITFPDGEIRTLHTVKTRFEDTKGQLFILGTSTDVTERELLIAQLEKSNADLEEFAYIASHDLKSPLNAIKKLVNWIEEDYGTSMPEGAKPHFEMIKSRASRLTNLLTDLLDYSRLNKQMGESESIQLERFVKILHAMNENAERFSLQVPSVEVQLPKIALQIVLLNLLSNTIKHHDQDKGNITIDVEQVMGGYKIHYKDDGPGIAKEYREKIFQMFLTLKTKDEVEGSGMGLAMVKKVLDFYGGHIELVFESDLPNPQGVHFEIFWPSSQVNLFGNLEGVAS